MDNQQQQKKPKVKLCNYYMDGECQNGRNCKFEHDSNACKYYFFFGNCEEKNCQYEHLYKQPKQKQQQQQQTDSNQNVQKKEGQQNRQNNQNKPGNQNNQNKPSNQNGQNKQSNQNNQNKQNNQNNQNNQSNQNKQTKQRPRYNSHDDKQNHNNNDNNNNDNNNQVRGNNQNGQNKSRQQNQQQQQQQQQQREEHKFQDNKNKPRNNNHNNNNNSNNNKRNPKNQKSNGNYSDGDYYSDEDHDNQSGRNVYYQNYRNQQYYQNQKKQQNNSEKQPLYGNSNSISQNTVDFQPNYDPSDMILRTEVYRPNSRYTRPINHRDVIIIPNMFTQDYKDTTIYDSLFKEIHDHKLENIWKLWHQDNHMIADDKMDWQIKCPTFNMVIKAIQDYFQMDINQTRLNWYRDSSEWKPYHFDAAAFKPDIAKKQNFTVGISFGAERDLAFEHDENKTVITCPMPNGSILAFSKEINVKWRHGIPQVPYNKRFNKGRISIIAWGKIRNMKED